MHKFPAVPARAIRRKHNVEKNSVYILDTIEKIIKAIIGLFAGFSTNAIAANADEDSEIERMLDDIEDAEKAS